jgi:hypothetical protein
MEARTEARAGAGAAGPRWPGQRVHFSGCGRCCGRPADTQIDVVATAEGYVYQ